MPPGPPPPRAAALLAARARACACTSGGVSMCSTSTATELRGSCSGTVISVRVEQDRCRRAPARSAKLPVDGQVGVERGGDQRAVDIARLPHLRSRDRAGSRRPDRARSSRAPRRCPRRSAPLSRSMTSRLLETEAASDRSGSTMPVSGSMKPPPSEVTRPENCGADVGAGDRDVDLQRALQRRAAAGEAAVAERQRHGAGDAEIERRAGGDAHRAASPGSTGRRRR